MRGATLPSGSDCKSQVDSGSSFISETEELGKAATWGRALDLGRRRKHGFWGPLRWQRGKVNGMPSRRIKGRPREKESRTEVDALETFGEEIPPRVYDGLRNKER